MYRFFPFYRDECDMPIPILAPVIDSEADNLTAEPDNLTLGAEGN